MKKFATLEISRSGGRFFHKLSGGHAANRLSALERRGLVPRHGSAHDAMGSIGVVDVDLSRGKPLPLGSWSDPDEVC